MNEEELKEKGKEIENPTDNIAGDETNEQFVKENPDWEPDDTDNVSDELAELKDSYLRLMAEYDNYRKRTLKEKAELIKNGGEKVLVGLLSVVDDFERALDNVKKASDISAVVDGIDLIYAKFMSFLSQNGVKPIETKEQSFEADLFDAVAMIPAPEKHLKGKVLECLQTGYMLNDKVIRHAKVVVAE